MTLFNQKWDLIFFFEASKVRLNIQLWKKGDDCVNNKHENKKKKEAEIWISSWNWKTNSYIFVLNRKTTFEQGMEAGTSSNLGRMEDWVRVKKLGTKWQLVKRIHSRDSSEKSDLRGFLMENGSYSYFILVHHLWCIKYEGRSVKGYKKSLVALTGVRGWEWSCFY